MWKGLHETSLDLTDKNINDEDIETMAKNHGWERVHSQLALVDPEAAARIHPKDPQRLQRALEVFLVSGKRLTEFFTEENEKRLFGQIKQPFNFHFFGKIYIFIF